MPANPARKVTQRLLGFCLVGLMLGGCTETVFMSHLYKKASKSSSSAGYFKVGNPYEIGGKTYYPNESYEFVETGIASWYGPGFHGKKTANGESFDENELTAAHRTLQMPSLVRITNLENGKSLVLRVNDRGPYAHGRVIDVSKRAAELLGFRMKGTARVKLEVIGPESRAIASAAKRGESTAGTEVAMNRYGRLHGYQNTPSKTLLAEDDETQMAMLRQQALISDAQDDMIASSPSSAPSAAPMDAVERQSLMRMHDAFPRNEMESVSLNAPQTIDPVQGHSKGGRFLPDPVVETYAVKPTRLFVQAGSFLTRDNAETLRAALGELGPVEIQQATISGQTFHRVRIGPFDAVDKADKMLNTLMAKGRSATIVVVEQ